MKQLLISILFLLMFQISAQIPNGSFEEWDQINTWEVPSLWKSNNASNSFISVTKVYSLTDGNHAMKVEPKGLSFEGYAPGVVSCSFLPIGNFNGVEASFQVDSVSNGGYVEIIILQKENDSFQQIGYWTSNVISQGIKDLHVTINPINSDSMKIEIHANSVPTPVGYQGYADIIVDKLDLSKTSLINDTRRSEINIFPNPSEGYITVEACVGCQYAVYNINGQLIKHGEILDDKIKIDEAGIFTLSIQKENNHFSKQIVVIKP